MLLADDRRGRWEGVKPLEAVADDGFRSSAGPTKCGSILSDRYVSKLSTPSVLLLGLHDYTKVTSKL